MLKDYIKQGNSSAPSGDKGEAYPLFCEWASMMGVPEEDHEDAYDMFVCLVHMLGKSEGVTISLG
jgi:hypothetical protein